MLLPRFLAETVSDPNPLNEMIKNSGPKFIDPGDIRRQQLSYVLCKHDGPFALIFPAFMKGNIAVSWSQTSVTIAPIHCETFKNFKKIHDIQAVMTHLRSLPNGKDAMQKRPFAILHLLFYAARQFFRDAQYAIAQGKTDRTTLDLALGSLAMDGIRQMLIQTANTLADQFPENTNDGIDTIFQNPDHFDQLNAIATQSYTMFIRSNSPIARLFSEFFASGQAIQTASERDIRVETHNAGTSQSPGQIPVVPIPEYPLL
jgi:predicted phage tail protein